MSAEKSPQRKKQHALDRDHVSPSKYNKAFRKVWPRKEAKLNRAFRLRSKVALATSTDGADVDAVRRKKAVKWGVLSMREHVVSKLEHRVHMHGAHKRRRAERERREGAT